MVLMPEVESDPVRTRKPDLAELSQRLRSLGREMRSLSPSQPDFRQRLNSLRTEINAVAARLRRVNLIGRLSGAGRILPKPISKPWRSPSAGKDHD